MRQWTLRGTIQSKIDVYLDHETFKVVQRSFPYLTDTKNATGGGEVALTNFQLIEAEIPFQIDGFEIIPFAGESCLFS